LAKKTLISEGELARISVELAQAGATRDAGAAAGVLGRSAHVGYYLLGKGLQQLEQAAASGHGAWFQAAADAPWQRMGTRALAQWAAARTTAGKLMTVAGGGDTVAALAKAHAVAQFSYVSTAGGAFLEWLEGKELPGVAALYVRSA
jgi:hypothetical protein